MKIANLRNHSIQEFPVPTHTLIENNGIIQALFYLQLYKKHLKLCISSKVSI